MRVCFFGDSFVNGTGDDTALGWVGRLVSAARASGCNITAYNLGIRSNTTEDILLRWLEEASRRLPDEYAGHLVFSFGANDCVWNEANGQVKVAPSQSVANASCILRQATAWLPTLMVGPSIIADDPEASRRIQELSSRYASLCAEISVPYLELAELLMRSELWLSEAYAGDGAHPNHEGYGIVAQMIQNWAPWQRWIEHRVERAQVSTECDAPSKTA